MGFPFSGYQSNVPQLDVDVDRLKAKTQGVALSDLFETLQVYLGSTYVNDFNLFGRTWRVYAQAEGDYRKKVEDITNLKTRNARGEMVPVGSMVNIKQSYGPDPVIRYNGYPAADFVGEANPALLSSAQAMDKITEIAGKVLPNGMSFEWTDLSFQEATQGTASLLVFPVAILLAFLVLAALYESLLLPLAGDLDRADVHAFGAGRCQAVRRRQQHLRAGRPRGTDGPGVQERDPDRGVRARAGIPGQGRRTMPTLAPEQINQFIEEGLPDRSSLSPRTGG